MEIETNDHEHDSSKYFSHSLIDFCMPTLSVNDEDEYLIFKDEKKGNKTPLSPSFSTSSTASIKSASPSSSTASSSPKRLKRRLSSHSERVLDQVKNARFEHSLRRATKNQIALNVVKWTKTCIHGLSLSLLLGLLYRPSMMIHLCSVWDLLSLQHFGLTIDAWVQPTSIFHVIGWIIVFLFSLIVILNSWWIGWVVYTFVSSITLWIIAIYQILRISLGMFVYGCVMLMEFMIHSSYWILCCIQRNKKTRLLYDRLAKSNNYKEWRDLAIALDLDHGKENWKSTYTENESFDFRLLHHNIEEITEALHDEDVDRIVFLITGFLKRNKLGIDSPDLHLECLDGTKHLIELYMQQVTKAVKWICTSENKLTHEEKLKWIKKLKRSFGSTALCLSGGGSIGMYHMGVIKSLAEADLLPNVASGSSGGSIAAAMLACKTNKEMLDTIIQENISTRFMQYDIAWFPPLINQIQRFLKEGVLVSNEEFERTTKFYYAEPLETLKKTKYYTFQDAYERTGRHVSITVSASDITGRKGLRKLLLNHINTPHVLLWSAVAVSCSLPGIMKGKNLMARDSQGNIVPYLSLGEEWIDGSMRGDLPMDTMASCFNVTNFIVSQVNPHVVPFISKDVDRPGSRQSIFQTLESVITTDVRHRFGMLSTLGLFPRVYGHQFSQWFQQSFIGDVTIVPNLISAESIGLKAILNPTVEDMKRYIHGGQLATWPKLSYIRHLCTIEKCLDECIAILSPKDSRTFKNWFHPNNLKDEEE